MPESILTPLSTNTVGNTPESTINTRVTRTCYAFKKNLQHHVFLCWYPPEPLYFRGSARSGCTAYGGTQSSQHVGRVGLTQETSSWAASRRLHVQLDCQHPMRGMASEVQLRVKCGRHLRKLIGRHECHPVTFAIRYARIPPPARPSAVQRAGRPTFAKAHVRRDDSSLMHLTILWYGKTLFCTSAHTHRRATASLNNSLDPSCLDDEHGNLMMISRPILHNPAQDRMERQL